MYGDQFGEFVYGYWGLKGYLFILQHLQIKEWILGMDDKWRWLLFNPFDFSSRDHLPSIFGDHLLCGRGSFAVLYDTIFCREHPEKQMSLA